MTVTIAFLNAAGLRDPTRLQNCLFSLRTTKYDFIFITETHLDSSFSNAIKANWNYPFYISEGSVRTKGVLLLTSRRAPQISSVTSDPNGRYIIASLQSGNKHLTLAGIYAPSGYSNAIVNERISFFDNLNTILGPLKSRGDDIIIGGDFNVTLGDRDRSPFHTRQFFCHSQQALRDLQMNLDLEDLWRTQNPYALEFTFFHQGHGSRTRIDRALTSTLIRPNTKVCHFLNNLSDHYQGVEVTISDVLPPKGKGSWCLNKAHLENEDFRTLIENTWRQWKTKLPTFDSILDWWEQGKTLIKKRSIAFAVEAKRANNAIISSLQKRLRNAHNKLHARPDLKPLINNLTQELREKISQDAQGHIVRTKTIWEVEGERCTRSFFQSLEKKQITEKSITAVYDPNGVLQTDTDGILHSVSEFYRDLYKDQPVSNISQHIILGATNKSISMKAKRDCEAPVTLRDISSALKSFAPAKSPGSDGLPMEFYRTFFDTLGPDLLKVYHAMTAKGEMPPSMRTAVISLLFKKGDRDDLKNWRPISLLNVDYKIFTKALTSKLSPALAEIIEPSQTASIKGRTILDNVSLARDLIDHLSKQKETSYVVALDQSKAFDRVDWSFLVRTLERFGFGPNFIGQVKLLYTNIYSQIKVNNFLTDPIPVLRGVRQGCPLSMLLYILVAEALANYVKANGNIVGVKFHNIEIKLSQFADDTSSFLANLSSLKELLAALTLYEQASGAKINLEKCEVYILGTDPPEDVDDQITLKTTFSGLKILGVFLSHDHRLVDHNWDK